MKLSDKDMDLLAHALEWNIYTYSSKMTSVVPDIRKIQEATLAEMKDLQSRIRAFQRSR